MRAIPLEVDDERNGDFSPTEVTWVMCRTTMYERKIPVWMRSLREESDPALSGV